MRYAQFFQLSTGYVPGTTPPVFDDAHKTLIEACGDRGVLIIDQRLKPKTAGEIAAAECASRGYAAYQIHEGESLTRSKPVSGIWPVSTGKEDRTAYSASYGA